MNPCPTEEGGSLQFLAEQDLLIALSVSNLPLFAPLSF